LVRHLLEITVFLFLPSIPDVEYTDFSHTNSPHNVDIWIEETRVRQNYDIFLQAGGSNIAISESFEVTIKGTTLNVTFGKLVGVCGGECSCVFNKMDSNALFILHRERTPRLMPSRLDIIHLTRLR
jgi:hypothetical protein